MISKFIGPDLHMSHQLLHHRGQSPEKYPVTREALFIRGVSFSGGQRRVFCGTILAHLLSTGHVNRHRQQHHTTEEMHCLSSLCSES